MSRLDSTSYTPLTVRSILICAAVAVDFIDLLRRARCVCSTVSSDTILDTVTLVFSLPHLRCDRRQQRRIPCMGIQGQKARR